MRSELHVNPREGEGVPWAKCAAWGTTIAIVLVACGGATRDSSGDATSSHIDGGGGGGGANDGSVASDAPRARVKCSDVSEGGECSTGDTCDADCSNPCQFCNFYSCSDGHWSQVEVAPLPQTDPQCTDGGDGGEGGVH